MLVMLFHLSTERQWVSQGTGIISISTGEKVHLHIASQDDGRVLMAHDFCRDIEYRKQDASIITWFQQEVRLCHGEEIIAPFPEIVSNLGVARNTQLAWTLGERLSAANENLLDIV
jgi:hypothetical protein